ncbi:hypothetical protein BC830DRAFT_218461 [Chytriomyces sp. MP71]|nr:hypothetical protein BC830DRAFT_218461 [Chytriomyces sp. MP71]
MRKIWCVLAMKIYDDLERRVPSILYLNPFTMAATSMRLTKYKVGNGRAVPICLSTNCGTRFESHQQVGSGRSEKMKTPPVRRSRRKTRVIPKDESPLLRYFTGQRPLQLAETASAGPQKHVAPKVGQSHRNKPYTAPSEHRPSKIKLASGGPSLMCMPKGARQAQPAPATFFDLLDASKTNIFAAASSRSPSRGAEGSDIVMADFNQSEREAKHQDTVNACAALLKSITNLSLITSP